MLMNRRLFGTFLVRKKVHRLKLEGTIASMSANDLCDAVSRATTEKVTLNSFWDDAANRAIFLMPTLKPSRIVHLCNMFSKAQIYNESFFNRVIQRLQDDIHSFTPRDLIVILNAFSRIGINDETTLQPIFTHLTQTLKKHTLCNERELNLLISSCGRLQIRHIPLLDIACQQALTNLHLFTPSGLAAVATGLSKLNFAHEPMIKKIASQAQNLTQLTAIQLAQIVTAISNLLEPQNAAAEHLKNLSHLIPPRMQSAGPPEASAIASAYNRSMKKIPQEVARSLADWGCKLPPLIGSAPHRHNNNSSPPTRAHYASLHQLGTILLAVSHAEFAHTEQNFHTLFTTSQPILSTLLKPPNPPPLPQELGMIAAAYSNMKMLNNHNSLLETLLEKATTNLAPNLDLQTKVTLLYSSSNLDLKYEIKEMRLKLVEMIASSNATFTPQEVAQLYYGMYKAGSYSDWTPIHSLLHQNALKNLNSLTQQHVANILYSIAHHHQHSSSSSAFASSELISKLAHRAWSLSKDGTNLESVSPQLLSSTVSSLVRSGVVVDSFVLFDLCDRALGVLSSRLDVSSQVKFAVSVEILNALVDMKEGVKRSLLFSCLDNISYSFRDLDVKDPRRLVSLLLDLSRGLQGVAEKVDDKFQVHGGSDFARLHEIFTNLMLHAGANLVKHGLLLTDSLRASELIDFVRAMDACGCHDQDPEKLVEEIFHREHEKKSLLLLIKWLSLVDPKLDASDGSAVSYLVSKASGGEVPFETLVQLIPRKGGGKSRGVETIV